MNAFLIIIVIFCDRDFWEHALNFSQYIVSDKNKQFRLELARKLNPWLKFEQNFFTCYKTANKKDHSSSAIFLIYSIFSKRNQIVFSHAKLMISWLQWLEKKWVSHARWWAIAILQLTELNIKANPPCLSMHVCTSARQWRHKLCAERMRNAKQGNDL